MTLLSLEIHVFCAVYPRASRIPEQTMKYEPTEAKTWTPEDKLKRLTVPVRFYEQIIKPHSALLMVMGKRVATC